MAARRPPKSTLRDAAIALAEAADAAPPVLDTGEEDELQEGVLEGLRRLDQGGSNRITWYVYNDALDKGGYIEKLKTDQLDEELFKSRYGPGEYRVFGRDGSGQFVKGSSTTVKIADIPGLTPKPRNNGALASAASAETDVVAMMRELRAADERRAAAAAEANKGWAVALGGPLATVAAAFISRPSMDVAALVAALRPPQSSLSEMTTAMVNLQTLQGDRTNTLDAVLKVLDRVQELPEGKPGEGGWIGLIRDVLREAAPHAKDLLTRLGPNTPPAGAAGGLPPGSTVGSPFGPGVSPRAPSALAPPAATPTNSAPPPSAPSAAAAPPMSGASAMAAGSMPPSPSSDPAADQAADMWRLAEPWLKKRADDLHEWATTNMDIELVADMLLESARKKFGMFVSLEQLAQFLQHPQWWEVLCAFHAPLGPYHAWCDDVRRALLDAIAHELRGDTDEDEPDGGEMPG